MCKLSTEKNGLDERIENQELKLIVLTHQISETEEQCAKLKLSNLSLVKKLKKVDVSNRKVRKTHHSFKLNLKKS